MKLSPIRRSPLICFDPCVIKTVSPSSALQKEKKILCVVIGRGREKSAIMKNDLEEFLLDRQAFRSAIFFTRNLRARRAGASNRMAKRTAGRYRFLHPGDILVNDLMVLVRLIFFVSAHFSDLLATNVYLLVAIAKMLQLTYVAT